ncbi:hypothetical protein LWI28_014559 [Acer negundo]|uniref:Uncharacterized protein n=1 Tax=Acer negundo TaxID=4023 RepID=A0AAD5IF30_ACENE|nr:hypothetical protein LWI28_014559 [Acer negundo]
MTIHVEVQLSLNGTVCKLISQNLGGRLKNPFIGLRRQVGAHPYGEWRLNMYEERRSSKSPFQAFKSLSFLLRIKKQMGLYSILSCSSTFWLNQAGGWTALQTVVIGHY